jgi:hypothetical protein
VTSATENLVTERQRPYLAYLLRLWQIQDKGKIGWRASLENAHTGERRGFAGLAELFAFLENEAGKGQPESGMGKRRGSAEKEHPYGVARIQDNGAYEWPKK